MVVPPKVRFLPAATVMVPVVFAPVALAFKVWPAPKVKAVVGADTSNVPLLPTMRFGVLTSEPEPLKVRVPPVMVVSPV